MEALQFQTTRRCPLRLWPCTVRHQTKTHIVRSINKEKVKQDALKSEDPQSAILIMEWAMKFLQIKFREKQSEWFGKRGLSWHISTLITKNVDSGKIELKIVCSYLRLLPARLVRSMLDHRKHTWGCKERTSPDYPSEPKEWRSRLLPQ